MSVRGWLGVVDSVRDQLLEHGQQEESCPDASLTRARE